MISWAKYKHVGRIKPDLHRVMEEIGIESGARPNHWYCSLTNIPSNEWLKVEKYDGAKWVIISAANISMK